MALVDELDGMRRQAQALADRMQQLKRERDSLADQRQALLAEITELEAYLAWKERQRP